MSITIKQSTTVLLQDGTKAFSLKSYGGNLLVACSVGSEKKGEYVLALTGENVTLVDLRLRTEYLIVPSKNNDGETKTSWKSKYASFIAPSMGKVGVIAVSWGSCLQLYSFQPKQAGCDYLRFSFRSNLTESCQFSFPCFSPVLVNDDYYLLAILQDDDIRICYLKSVDAAIFKTVGLTHPERDGSNKKRFSSCCWSKCGKSLYAVDISGNIFSWTFTRDINNHTLSESADIVKKRILFHSKGSIKSFLPFRTIRNGAFIALFEKEDPIPANEQRSLHTSGFGSLFSTNKKLTESNSHKVSIGNNKQCNANNANGTTQSNTFSESLLTCDLTSESDPGPLRTHDVTKVDPNLPDLFNISQSPETIKTNKSLICEHDNESVNMVDLRGTFPKKISSVDIGKTATLTGEMEPQSSDLFLMPKAAKANVPDMFLLSQEDKNENKNGQNFGPSILIEGSGDHVPKMLSGSKVGSPSIATFRDVNGASIVAIGNHSLGYFEVWDALDMRKVDTVELKENERLKGLTWVMEDKIAALIGTFTNNTGTGQEEAKSGYFTSLQRCFHLEIRLFTIHYETIKAEDASINAGVNESVNTKAILDVVKRLEHRMNEGFTRVEKLLSIQTQRIEALENKNWKHEL